MARGLRPPRAARGPARLGRPWGGADTAQGDEGEGGCGGRERASGDPQPGGGSAQEALFGPGSLGVGEVDASVNRRRLYLPLRLSLPQPLKRSLPRPNGFYYVCFLEAPGDRAM